MNSDDGYVLFVHWTCYYAVQSGVIVKQLPVVLRPDAEPAGVMMRGGVQCQRVHFDPVKRYVAYAHPAAMDDLRTVVDLVRGD